MQEQNKAIFNHPYFKLMKKLDIHNEFLIKLWKGDKQVEKNLIYIICDVRDDQNLPFCSSFEDYRNLRNDFIRKYPQFMKRIKKGSMCNIL